LCLQPKDKDEKQKGDFLKGAHKLGAFEVNYLLLLCGQSLITLK
jgi:hypothetical protein